MLVYFFKKYIFPVATLTGGVVGVGFLSLPYIALQVGFLPMLFYFIVMTVFVTLVHVIFVKVSLKTPDHKRWPGFVGYYFGPIAKKIVLTQIFFGLLGVMLAYVIVGSQFLENIGAPWLGINDWWYSFLFVALASFFIYSGAKIVAKIDVLALSSLLFILLVIVIKEFAHIKFSNIIAPVTPWTDVKTMLLPFGVIMFSLWGIGIIPTIEEMVAPNKKALPKIVALGIILPAIFYFCFTFLLLGITGSKTTPSALTGLVSILPYDVAMIALAIGAITTFVAFVAQGLLLKEILIYDASLPPKMAWGLVCVMPLVFLLLGLNGFISIISFIGGFLLPIDGILISLMYLKIGGKKWLAYSIMVVLIGLELYQIAYFIG